MTPKKRGRKALEKNPLAAPLTQLEKENRRLQNKLKKAEIVIDVQKKIFQILSIESEDPQDKA